MLYGWYPFSTRLCCLRFFRGPSASHKIIITGVLDQDTKTRNLEFIENERKLFYTIRYNDIDYDMLTLDFERYRNCFIRVIVEKKTNKLMFDEYINKLNSVEVSELNIIESFGETKQEQVDIDTTKDTLSIINDEIDHMEEVPNKNKLKSIIHTLYLESLSQ